MREEAFAYFLLEEYRRTHAQKRYYVCLPLMFLFQNDSGGVTILRHIGRMYVKRFLIVCRNSINVPFLDKTNASFPDASQASAVIVLDAHRK